MTDTDKLAAIEARRNEAIGTEGDPLPVLDLIVKDVPWLIAEVRRLKGAIRDIGQQSNDIILKMTNDAIERAEDEYARGRADERAAVVRYIRATAPSVVYAIDAARGVEHGDHLQPSPGPIEPNENNT